MKCSASLEELSAYADGELNHAQMLAIEEHLRSCGTCREELASLRGVSRAFGLASEIEPGVSVRGRVARRLAMTEDSPDFACARMQISMSAMLDGELREEDALVLQAHVSTCPACAAEVATLESVALSVRAIPDVELPLGLERRIRTAIAREEQGVFSLGWLRSLFQPRLAPGMATAMAGATLIVGFWVGRLFPVAAPRVAPVAVAPAAVKPVATRTGTVAPNTTIHVAAQPGSTRTSRRRTPAPVRRKPADTQVAVQHTPAPAPAPARRTETRATATAKRAPETPRAPSTAVATKPLVPDVRPLPETPPPVVETPTTPAPAPVVPPAPAVVATRPAPTPVEAQPLPTITVPAPSAARGVRHPEWWRKAQVDVDQAAAALRSQPQRKAVVARIIKASF